MWVEAKGIKVAVDSRIKIYLNGALYAVAVATPVELNYLVEGLLYARGAIDDLAQIKSIDVVEGEEGVDVKVTAEADASGAPEVLYEDCGIAYASAARARLAEARDLVGVAMELAPQFSKFTMPSIEPTLAMHTSALYVDKRWIVAHDTSRHSSVLKLVGKALEQGLNHLENAIAFTTGRLSSDMVVALLRLGVPVAISLRGPLYSAWATACKYGMTIVANVRGRGFVQLCP
jgi:FdhD protein|nr:MAG: hypothetical protein TU35_07540 [Thermoproteus sp. AZ2]